VRGQGGVVASAPIQVHRLLVVDGHGLERIACDQDPAHEGVDLILVEAKAQDV
jgi:hypothetical protein